MIKLFFFILIIPFNLLLAQVNTAPEVTNVTFTQRDDGSFMVDIFYDVNDVDGDTMSVTMQVSDDAGAAWNFSCENITGDVGSDITSGTSKHIVWDFGVEHPQTFGEQFQIKIIANDYNLQWGTVTDIDGNVYKTVKIGEQWWMAENLKVTHYRNGEAIPNITDNSEWTNLTTGAWCTYNNDDGYIATYGLQYNWYAMDDSCNIAPVGWHVPSNTEWETLAEYLGGSSVAGGKMKTTGTVGGGDGLWLSPNTGATNESGFSGLPSYYRFTLGNFGGLGDYGYLWSSTEYSSANSWGRVLHTRDSDIQRQIQPKYYGYSVRCVRD